LPYFLGCLAVYLLVDSCPKGISYQKTHKSIFILQNTLLSHGFYVHSLAVLE